MNTRSSICVVASVVLFVALAGCGGGGGGGTDSTSTSTTSTPTSYSSVALAGELVTYSVDTTRMTYSYTITESQFGLTGHSGSGSLVKVGNGVYGLSNIPGASLVELPNGLLLGAVRDNFGTRMVTVPIMGFSNPVSSFAAAAGLYNFIQRSCVSTTCASAYGTFQIDPGGTWISCPSGNLAAGACPGGDHSGTLNALGNGMFQIMDGTTDIGTAIGMSSGGQNVILLDLKDQRPNGFGVGLLAGSTAQSVGPAQANGQWMMADSTGNWASFTMSGSSMMYSMMNGMPSTQTSSVTYNSPWMGFASTSSGVALLAGSGVYVYEQANGYAQVGMKLQ